MSGMTMIQGIIAEDLDAHEAAMWFTSAFLIPMSSLAPVAGRLATIFPPRALVLPVAATLAIGGLVCASAQSLGVFIAGRVLAGAGGAGVLTLAVIFVLELTSEKSRGVFVGLVNAGFTMGVSFGAVVSGALMPVIGWVSDCGLSRLSRRGTDTPSATSVLDPSAVCCRLRPRGLLQHSQRNGGLF